jgi:hypothetical protein
MKRFNVDQEMKLQWARVHQLLMSMSMIFNNRIKNQ